MIAELFAESYYSGSLGSIKWQGFLVREAELFRSYMKRHVRIRVRDDEEKGPLSVELSSMATTGMETAFVANFMEADRAERSWAIGEALAECIMADDPSRQIIWPWNRRRDLQVPNASLPGADLVGFCQEGEDVCFVFGEVKTSSQRRAPPQVMLGAKGMERQLAKLAVNTDTKWTLLYWIRARCRTAERESLFRAAAKRFIQSGGNDILLVGMLMRDTEPTERDVAAQAKSLADKVDAPARLEIVA
ncbi:MAG: hypothetical protein OXM02_05375 [Bacteroidota bacterium]|nr:hypothetical protein [Bacteroidota bacterium]MDE2958259.1 hypothetical protein [Bacteroidota bacterium]